MPLEVNDSDRALLKAATHARARAHAPFSNYRVGAALRTATGMVIEGCNVEYILLSLSCCAEQVALLKAVSDGHTDLEAVAVITDSSPPAAPCGSCRQALHAWGVQRVIMGNVDGEAVVCLLSELLPMAFALKGPVRPS